MVVILNVWATGFKSMRTNILIIGAGPYGISLFYELKRQKQDVLIVGSPFSLWMNHMINILNLRSNILASEIYSTDNRFSWKAYFNSIGMSSKIDKRMRIPVTWFQHYAQWILSQLPAKPIEDKIIYLDHLQNQFVATTVNGLNIEAKQVVIATGIGEHLYLPPSLTPLESKRVIHSYYTNDYQDTKDKKILVLGAGQSAGDTLIALSPFNKLVWAHRKPVIYYHEPLNIPRKLFNIIHRLTPVFYYFPRTINSLLGKKFVSPTIDPIVKDKIRYKNVEEFQLSIEDLELKSENDQIVSQKLNQSFDCIIACTGYKFKLSTFNFLSQTLKDKIKINNNAIPSLNWSFETTFPGLYMIGGIAEYTHGPAVRFMMGCRQATLNVSRALTR